MSRRHPLDVAREAAHELCAALEPACERIEIAGDAGTAPTLVAPAGDRP